MQNNSNQKTAGQIATIKKEFFKYFRFWYIFLLAVSLAIILVQLRLRYTPKLYTTVSKIKILDKGKGLELPSASFIFNRSNINLDNEIELIKSFDVLQKVVDRTDLTYRWYDEGNVLTTEIVNLPLVTKKRIQNSEVNYRTIKFKINDDGIDVLNDVDESLMILPEYTTLGLEHSLPFDIFPPEKNQLRELIGKVYVVKTEPIAAATSNLKNQLKVEITGKSSDVLQLTLNGANAQRAEDILNALHDVFNEDGMNDRQLVLQRTLEFIDERFSILMNELNTIEIDKKDFKLENKFLSPESDLERGMSIVIQSEEELYKMDIQLGLLDFLRKQLIRDTKGLTLLPTNLGLDGIDVNSLITDYNSLIIERENLDISAGINNPRVVQIDQTIVEMQKNMIASLDNMRLQMEMLKSNLEIRDKDINKEVAAIPEKERLFRDIERQQKIKETLYLFLFQKREEAAINLAITEPSIKIIEEPLSNQISSGLNKNNGIFIAFAAGIGLPFAVLYVIFLLDTKLHNREDLLSFNPDIPVIGEIPIIKNSKETLFRDPNDRTVLAEAFRILSSNVNFLLPLNQIKRGHVILCTSTIKGEGKTYVSMNLSLALSSLNKKVLLIGTDLRNPQIHTLINIEKNRAGLTDYLNDSNFNWRNAIVKGFDKHPGHDIILSGSIPPNPAHLLTNGRLDKLIEEARQEYDYILIDTAPTILVTDTMLISKLADVTVYITRADYTEKGLLNYSKDLVESKKLKNMAYVINGVSLKKSYGYGYGYGYSYNYGYNYGYGSDGKK